MNLLRLKFAFCILFIFSVKAQTDNLPTGVHPDVQSLEDKYLSYFDSTGAIIDSSQLKTALKVGRSYRFWERRGANGFAAYGQNTLDFWQNNEFCQDNDGYPNTSETKWKHIPMTPEPTVNSYDLYAGGTGAVFSHWVNPSNPQEIFVGGSSGGLWKTTNGGGTWTNLTDKDYLPNHGVGAISVDPTNTNNIIISMRLERHSNNLNIGVFRTTNGGNTWHQVLSLYTPTDPIGIVDIKRKPDEPNVIFAISKTGIYKSSNGGSLFSLMTSMGGVANCDSDLQRIFINPYNTNQVFLLGKLLYVSNNTGSTFAEVTDDIPLDCANIKSINMDVAEDNSNTLVLSVTEFIFPSKKRYYFESTDGANSWTLKGSFTPLGTGINSFVAIQEGLSFNGGIVCWKINHDPFQAGSTGGLLASTYGTTFLHEDIRNLSKVKVGNSWHLYAGTDGGLFKSTDLGLTWDLITDNLDLTEVFDIDTHSKSKNVYVGTQDMGEAVLSKKSMTWDPSIRRGDYMNNVLNLTEPPTCFAKDYQYSTIQSIKESDINDETLLGGGIMLGHIGAPNYTGRCTDYKTKTNSYAAHSNVINLNLEDHTYSHITNYPELTGLVVRPNCISLANANSNPNVLYAGWFMAGAWGYASGNPAPNLFKGVKDGSGNWTWTNISSYSNTQSLGSWVLPRTICVHPEDENTLMVGMDAPTLSGTNNPRALYSTNGGQTWVDKSYGLPMNFGVNEIVYQKGTDNRYYAATDIGVYYFDPDFEENGHVGKWRCFNFGLPNVMVTDLSIDYCNSTLYAGTFGRGLWEAPLMTTDMVDLVVSTDQTWDFYKEVVGDIYVTNGAVLTIKGDLVMQNNARIQVEPGAELRVEGGRITSACEDTPWYGIVAEGTSTQHQSPGSHPTYQSLIYLKDAVIENAKNAITTAKLDENYNVEWGYSGAVIKAYDTHFKNNRRSVAYMSYQNFNPSNNNPRSNYGRFINCSFTVDQEYIDHSPYDYNIQVTAWEVKGVKFSACHFEMPFNTTQTAGAIESKGIFALDASLRISSQCTSPVNQFPCTQYNRSSFKGYDVAVDIDNTNSMYPIEIDRTDFLNNYHAISLNRANYSRITRCDINNTKYYQGYTGINLYNTVGFSIEENHIKTQSGDITGIRAKDLYNTNFLQDDIIYNNKIASARHGIELKGSIGVLDLGGLVAECNDFGANVPGFNDNKYDIRINPVTITKTIWGSNNDPMENYFSQTNTQSERNIKVAANVSLYPNLHTYYWNGGLVLTNPEDISSSIVTHSVNQTSRNCKSTLKTYYDNSPQVLRSDYHLKKASFKTLYTNYKSILNGGITQEILDDLLDISNTNNDALIQNLIDKSPYLSDEVLIEAIHYPYISDWDLTQILVWNGPLTPQVQHEVSQSGRFTASYLNLILDRTGVSQRALLDQQLAQKIQGYSLAGNHYYQRVLLDSNLTVFDTTDVFVDSLDLSALSVDNQLALDWYINTKQYTKALAFLDCDTVYLPEDSLSHFKDFKRLTINLFSKGGNWFNMSQSRIDSLIDMGNDTTKTDYQLAQNVLEFLDIQRFAEPTSDPDILVKQLQPIVKPDVDSVQPFKIWPNPVADQLKVVWKTTPDLGDLQIDLIDVLGKTVSSNLVNGQNGYFTLPCNTYTPGTYILNIQYKGKTYQEKVEIMP